jgi:hypothetical protein
LKEGISPVLKVLVSATKDIKIARLMMDTLNILSPLLSPAYSSYSTIVCSSPFLTLDDATKNAGRHFVRR